MTFENNNFCKSYTFHQKLRDPNFYSNKDYRICSYLNGLFLPRSLDYITWFLITCVRLSVGPFVCLSVIRLVFEGFLWIIAHIKLREIYNFLYIYIYCRIIKRYFNWRLKKITFCKSHTLAVGPSHVCFFFTFSGYNIKTIWRIFMNYSSY